ncbi:EAL domain-containing protein [Actinoplanes sp. DH11]|uniref:EAL domain-containing protein n=1 Tax=Actinoplanes sp. DH11 TaxID=2857011 RepID=UPI001E6262A4|nr:EAL domain-containing protein [Actinoplanes sp. DH11]
MPTTPMPVETRTEADACDDAAAVAALLRDRSVAPLFQPIVDLATGAVVAAEALARGPAGSGLERPDQLFAAAARAGRLGPVDMLCAERALECAIEAPDIPPLVFVNAEPAVLGQPVSSHLVDLLVSGLRFRVVLEYTERALSTVPAGLLRIAGMAHGMGNGIALDDVGADPMSLALLPFVDPDVIKLDMHLLRNPAAPATLEVCAAVSAAARRTGALIIAEGIETAADVDTARALGAHWGQGWHFGRPVRAADLPAPPADRTVGLRAPRPGLHQPAGSPFQVAVAGGARPADETTIRHTMERMHTIAGTRKHAVVLGSDCATVDTTVWRPYADQVTRNATYAATLCANGAGSPFPGESCLLVVTPEDAVALCHSATRGETVHTEDRDLVTAIGRVLLQRLED